MMNEAENLITRGKISEADIILASVPSNRRKTELLSKICIEEAKQKISDKDYVSAERLLRNIAIDSVPDDLQHEINLMLATALLGQGRYVEADGCYASLEQNDNIIKRRKELFYESRILQCAVRTKNDLIFPESLTIIEAVCLNKNGNKQAESNTNGEDSNEYNQPTIILHYHAKSRGGSITDGFQRYIWNTDEKQYEQKISVDTLSADDEKPSGFYSYWSVDEQKEYLKTQHEILSINVDLMTNPIEMEFDEDQLTTINIAVQQIKLNDVDLITNNEIVHISSS